MPPVPEDNHPAEQVDHGQDDGHDGHGHGDRVDVVVDVVTDQEQIEHHPEEDDAAADAHGVGEQPEQQRPGQGGPGAQTWKETKLCTETMWSFWNATSILSCVATFDFNKES